MPVMSATSHFHGISFLNHTDTEHDSCHCSCSDFLKWQSQETMYIWFTLTPLHTCEQGLCGKTSLATLQYEAALHWIALYNEI